MDRTKRACHWQAWQAHVTLYPGGDGSRARTDQLPTFAVAVWEGKYGLGSQVKVQSVKQALRHVAQGLILDGHPDPRQESAALQSLNLPISRLLKKFWDDNLKAEPKLAIPVSMITAIANNYRWDPHKEAVTDLIIIAFFYLLQVEEYISPLKSQEKRTIALWDCDVPLWKDGKLLPHSARLEALLLADSATICIAHTKNGTKGAVAHHNMIRGPICPTAALAGCIANIQQGSNKTHICWVYHASGASSWVADQDIGGGVRWGATFDCLLTWGYMLDRISSHSLRAGGAMAMKLSGASDSTIIKVGRWTLLTYLTYIHSQIGMLMAGLAWWMSTAFTFQNVG